MAKTELKIPVVLEMSGSAPTLSERYLGGLSVAFLPPIQKTASQHYIEAATSINTRRAYRADIRHFESWGGLLPAKTDQVIAYLQEHAQSLNARTLERRLVALKHWHNYQGFADPTNHPFVPFNVLLKITLYL